MFQRQRLPPHELAREPKKIFRKIRPQRDPSGTFLWGFAKQFKILFSNLRGLLTRLTRQTASYCLCLCFFFFPFAPPPPPHTTTTANHGNPPAPCTVTLFFFGSGDSGLAPCQLSPFGKLPTVAYTDAHAHFRKAGEASCKGPCAKNLHAQTQPRAQQKTQVEKQPQEETHTIEQRH